MPPSPTTRPPVSASGPIKVSPESIDVLSKEMLAVGASVVSTASVPLFDFRDPRLDKAFDTFNARVNERAGDYGEVFTASAAATQQVGEAFLRLDRISARRAGRIEPGPGAAAAGLPSTSTADLPIWSAHHFEGRIRWNDAQVRRANWGVMMLLRSISGPKPWPRPGTPWPPLPWPQPQPPRPWPPRPWPPARPDIGIAPPGRPWPPTPPWPPVQPDIGIAPPGRPWPPTPPWPPVRPDIGIIGPPAQPWQPVRPDIGITPPVRPWPPTPPWQPVQPDPSVVWPGGTPPWIFDEAVGGPNPEWQQSQPLAVGLVGRLDNIIASAPAARASTSI